MVNFMKNNHIFALIFVMLVQVIFSGCKITVKEIVREVAVPPDTLMPLTFNILQ